MFRSFFNKPTASLGKATLDLLAPSTISLSLGPIDKTYFTSFKRYLTTDKVTQHDEKHQIIVIGGGISALLGGIKPFYQEYQQIHQGRAPKITFITDERSHWLQWVAPVFYSRPWGQAKNSLIKEYQHLLTKHYPELQSNEHPTFYHVRKTRENCIEQFAKQYNVEILNEHVSAIRENSSKLTFSLEFKSGLAAREYNAENATIYNLSSMPRPTEQPGLAHCREGGLLYSEKDLTQPILVYGSGLSATWAAMDWKGPLLVLHKKQFPLHLNGKPKSSLFYEMIEENTRLEVLRNGQVLVEGEDIHSRETITMLFKRDKCFLANGTVFNHDLTKYLQSTKVHDINTFSGAGQIAGELAQGSINPAGGLTHRYAVTAMLLKRYPVNDFKSIAVYTNLWQEEVVRRLATRGIVLDETFFAAITPKIRDLFQIKRAPTLDEIEEILKTNYELIPASSNSLLPWSGIKDILVPVTDDMEHSLHPEYYPEANEEKSQMFGPMRNV